MINYKKIMGMALAAALAISGTTLAYAKISSTSNQDENGITVLPYTAAPEQPEPSGSGFEITQYDKGEAAGWVSDRELLTLIKKDAENEYAGSDDSITEYEAKLNAYYIGIYNLDTGNTKEFQDVNLGSFISISPDRKFVLYEEPKVIPEGEEWEKQLKSGKLLNHSIKILNLVTGEIFPLITKYKNKDAGYIWTSDSKLVACYPFEKEWQFIDPDGTVYKTGTIGEDYLYTVGTDASIVEGEVKGNIYIKMSKSGSENTWMECVDVKTGQVTRLLDSERYYTIIRQNGVMLRADVRWESEDKKVTTLSMVDENGSIQNTYTFEDALIDIHLSAVSPDGKKVALAEMVEFWSHKIILLDLETGKTSEVVRCNSVENLNWNMEGNMLSFSSRPSSVSEATSKIVSFR